MLKFKNKAFSLVESIIAIALVGIIILSFFAALTLSINYVRRSLELRVATLILQEQLSLVRDLKYSDIQALGNSFVSADMASLKNVSGTIIKSAYGNSKILKITYRLDWVSFDGRAENKSIVTLITEEGIDKR